MRDIAGIAHGSAGSYAAGVSPTRRFRRGRARWAARSTSWAASGGGGTSSWAIATGSWSCRWPRAEEIVGGPGRAPSPRDARRPSAAVGRGRGASRPGSAEAMADGPAGPPHRGSDMTGRSAPLIVDAAASVRRPHPRDGRESTMTGRPIRRPADQRSNSGSRLQGRHDGPRGSRRPRARFQGAALSPDAQSEMVTLRIEPRDS